MNYEKLNYEQIKSIIFYFESLPKEDLELLNFNNQNDLLMFISKSQGFNNWFSYKTYLLKKQKDKHNKIEFQHNSKSNLLWNHYFSEFTFKKLNFLPLESTNFKFDYFSNTDKLTAFSFGYTQNSITKTKQPLVFKPIHTHIYTENKAIIDNIKYNFSNNINYLHISKNKNNSHIDFLKETFDTSYFDEIFLEDFDNINQFNFIWLHIIKYFYSTNFINIENLLNSLSINFLINAYFNIEKKEAFLSNILLKYLKKLPSLSIYDFNNISWNQETVNEHKKNCENIFLKLFEIKQLYDKGVFYELNYDKNKLTISNNEVNLYISDNVSLFGIICIEKWIDLKFKNNNNPIVFINEHTFNFSSKYLDKNIITIMINPNKEGVINSPSQIIFGSMQKPFDFSVTVKDVIFSSLKSLEINPFYMNNNLLRLATNSDCYVWQPQHLNLNDFNNFDYHLVHGKLNS